MKRLWVFLALVTTGMAAPVQLDTVDVTKLGIEWGNMLWGNSVCLHMRKLVGKYFSFRLAYEYSKFNVYISQGSGNFMGFAYNLENAYDVTFWNNQFNLMFQYHVMRNKEVMGFSPMGIGWALYSIRNENILTAADGLEYKNHLQLGTNGLTFIINFVEYCPKTLPGLSFSLGFKGVMLRATVPESLDFHRVGMPPIYNKIREPEDKEHYAILYPQFYLRASYTIQVERRPQRGPRGRGKRMPPPRPQPRPPQPAPEPGTPPGTGKGG